MNQTRYIYVKLGNGTVTQQIIDQHIQNSVSHFNLCAGEFDVLVDDGNEAIYEVETIFTHPKYQPETYHNDIALMKLAKPIKFSRFILPACLPEQDFAEKVNTDTNQHYKTN